jgi:hypothetical protein
VTTANGHQHVEAFMLMQYGCKACRFVEIIWNSRDGVTPFAITCRQCGAAATHIRWNEDEYAPSRLPSPGERVFRDGSPMEAEEIVRRRIAAAEAHGYAVRPDIEEIMLREARTADPMGEFAPGWPKLVEVAL